MAAERNHSLARAATSPITLDMLEAGMTAYREFDPEQDAPEALVYAILYRAEKIRRRNEAITLRPR
jgi:hypothetical protein